MAEPNYRGEAQLLSWSDTPAGRKITFLLPDEGEEHQFKGFKTGPKYGQCFAVITQPIDYDNPEEETPKAGDAVKSVAGYAQSESQRCAMLCGDPQFWSWLLRDNRMSPGWEPSTEWATDLVKLTCGMESRKVLDSDPEGEPSKRWLRMKAQFEQETGKIAEKRR